MNPERRSDRELVEQMLMFLNDIKTVTTEGELAATLKINSETANKWLEIFLLIKKNCPEFQYKKFGRYRLIDKIGLEGLDKEISEVELKHVSAPRFRVTRFMLLNNIHDNIRKLSKLLIWGPRNDDMTDWDARIKSSNEVLLRMIKSNLNNLAKPEGVDAAYHIFKSSIDTCLDDLIKSVKEIMTDDAKTSTLKLITIERNFIKKLTNIFSEFEKAELKAGKKPDLLPIEEESVDKPFTETMLGEVKYKIEDPKKALKKVDKKDLERSHLKPKMQLFLECTTCSIEQEIPIHCTQRMDYEDGQLVCEICRKTLNLPVCSKCKKPFGIGIKEIKN